MSTEIANQRLLNSSRQYDGNENGYSLIYPRPGLGICVPPGMSIRYIPSSREQEVSGHFIANAHSGYLDKSGCGATVTSAMARVAAWVTAPLAVVWKTIASLEWPLANKNENEQGDEESLRDPDYFDRAWRYANTDLRGRPAYDGPDESDEHSRLLLPAYSEHEEEPVGFTKRFGKIFGF